MKAPAWLLKCHPNSYLNARDFAAILGLNQAAFNGRVKRGRLPQPTYTADGNHHNREWRVGDLLKDFFEREEK